MTATISKDTNSQNYASGRQRRKTRIGTFASKVTIFIKSLFCFTSTIKSKGNINYHVNHSKLSTSGHCYPALLTLCHSRAHTKNEAICTARGDNCLHNSNQAAPGLRRQVLQSISKEFLNIEIRNLCPNQLKVEMCSRTISQVSTH